MFERDLRLPALMACLFLIASLGAGASLAQPTGDETCTLFGVQDTDEAFSIIFRLDLLDPLTGESLNELTELDTCDACDIEASDIDPTDGTWYAFAGGASSARFPAPGDLFTIDTMTGGLTPIGNTGAVEPQEIVAASFHPDGTLWAFQEQIGLLTVDLGTAAPNVEFALNANWEGLAWNADGDLLYGTDGIQLFVWDPSDSSLDLVCDNLGGLGAMVEALEFNIEGDLIGSLHDNVAERLVQILLPDGPGDCTVLEIGDGLLPEQDNDIETLTFRACAPPDCGDGDVDEDAGETCDPPGSNDGEPNECRSNCTFCGDGHQDSGEECDDRNNDDGDGCSATCKLEDDEMPDDETPDDETPDDETPDDETPDDETPDDETPDDETPDDETPDDETSDDETPDDETSDDEGSDDHKWYPW